ncbi:Cysteine-rich secretory protein family protein [Paraliobacillus sp. PM-2]|uniref:CAP domain-containing protein n=1 Tax=Paraliobacillus sp. PM-2 TaxID=1462524 RepID=UPI00061C34F5|nr:CAP domain-containing protein [Paraliobacillus sp. PM-2]CQR46014.1 Cysteine-rich secretory protein family protein [Paraliobacillus sp. PM-2]
MKKPIVVLTIAGSLLMGCTNNTVDQAEQQRDQLNTEPISFGGENPHSTQEQQTKKPTLPIEPGREQNIFTNENGIRTTPPEESQKRDEQQNQANQSFQKEVIQLTNAERKKQGLAELQMDSELSKAAQTKSEDMAKNNYFSHTSPTYGSPFDMLQEFGIDYTTAAENIASGQQSAQEVVTGWMNSPGHRKNILNKKVTHIGVGYAADGAYWTQLFIAK